MTCHIYTHMDIQNLMYLKSCECYGLLKNFVFFPSLKTHSLRRRKKNAENVKDKLFSGQHFGEMGRKMCFMKGATAALQVKQALKQTG